MLLLFPPAACCWGRLPPLWIRLHAARTDCSSVSPSLPSGSRLDCTSPEKKTASWGYQAEALAQAPEWHVADVDAFDDDLAARDMRRPKQRQRQRALAAAVRPMTAMRSPGRVAKSMPWRTSGHDAE